MGCAYSDLGEGKKALSCFKKAAGLNCHEAFARIGDIYRYGNGVGQDDTMARKWYGKGADVGEIMATLKLAECYRDGIGGKQDFEKSMLEYQHIAERIKSRGFRQQAPLSEPHCTNSAICISTDLALKLICARLTTISSGLPRMITAPLRTLSTTKIPRLPKIRISYGKTANALLRGR